MKTNTYKKGHMRGFIQPSLKAGFTLLLNYCAPEVHGSSKSKNARMAFFAFILLIVLSYGQVEADAANPLGCAAVFPVESTQ